MIRLFRLLRSILPLILIASVVALAFVAYTQCRSQQHWHSLYRDELQQDYKHVGFQVTIQLVRYNNVTDIAKTKFLDNQHRPIKPMLIELPSSYDYVVFWFNGNTVGDTILLHLPNWAEDDCQLITVPFMDWSMGGFEPLVIPSGLCPQGTYPCDLSIWGTYTCCSEYNQRIGNEANDK